MEDDLLRRLQNIYEELREKNPKAAIDLKNSIDRYQTDLSVDKDLLIRLKDIANIRKEQLMTGDQYPDLLKKISKDSIIIYFKSADVFRVYDGSQVTSDLTNHLNADFSKNKDIYEVIPNDLPQKIIIMCEKGIAGHMKDIISYVIEFMESKGVKGMKESDIRTFENDSGFVEIIVNGFYAANYDEREKIVRGLMRFIDLKEKNSMVTDKMRRHEFTPFENTQMVAMPNCKTQLDGRGFNLVDVLIRNIDQCKNLSTGNVYINIGTLNVADTVNMADTINNNMSPKKKKTVVGDFCSYIKTNKPDWYTPEKWIPKDLLRNKYIEQFGNITGPKFHKIFVDKIFKNSRRATIKGDRVTQVLLFHYDDILDINDQ